MGQVALAAAAVSMGLQTAGSLMQGSAQRQIAEYNARIEEENARQARKAAAERVRQIREASREATGRIKTGWAKTGLDINTGTTLDVIRDSETQYELDALKAEQLGKLQALGFENSARIIRHQGRLAQRFGYLGAAFSIASGATQLYTATERGRTDRDASSLSILSPKMDVRFTTPSSAMR